MINSFSWYFFGQLTVARLAGGYDASLNLLLGITFPLSIVLSALAGSIFLPKTKRARTLYGWLLFGTAASLLPAVPVGNSFVGTLTIIATLGTSLGVGMPWLLRWFSESLPIENRGKVAGLTFFMIMVSAPLFIIATSGSELLPMVLFLALWRSWSIPTLRAYPADIVPRERELKTSFRRVFDNKAFILYFIAWLMFSMVDGFEQFAISQHQVVFGFTMTTIEPAIAGISALVGGILADRAGRKRIIIFGFASLGIAYAVLGIASQEPISWLLYFVVDGVAIGLLWMMFTIVVWGELEPRGIEKYYAVGEAPFFMTEILYVLSTSFVASIPQASAFSLAAFFLFIAVIPLLYAPETLPEKKIQDRQLKIYFEEALKLKQKAT